MFIFMFGIPTRDLNPIYNVPMLGTHKSAHPTAGTLLFEFGLYSPPWMAYSFARELKTTYER
jgi:hypothetical protein